MNEQKENAILMITFILLTAVISYYSGYRSGYDQGQIDSGRRCIHVYENIDNN